MTKSWSVTSPNHGDHQSLLPTYSQLNMTSAMRGETFGEAPLIDHGRTVRKLVQVNNVGRECLKTMMTLLFDVCFTFTFNKTTNEQDRLFVIFSINHFKWSLLLVFFVKH